MERKLADLEQKLKAAFGSRLVSVVLYGSAAMDDWQERGSDLNILCVLTGISPQELKDSAPVFKWWRELGNPPPLLLSAEELRRSTDCFPMEFHDMQERRRVLCGEDLIKDLVIDKSFYRALVEHELRAKQIRLRQKAAELLSQPDRLLKLMTDSVSTFCVLGRHALILSNNEPKWKKKEILDALGDVTGTPMRAANEILAVREAGGKDAKPDAYALLGQYLKETESLVQFVDALER